MVVEKVDLPAGSLIAASPFRDYADAYRVRVDAAEIPDVDTFARRAASRAPRWVSGLMRARDAVVGVFGLERSIDAPPSARDDEPLVPGAFVSFFRITERNDCEIVAGEDDSHLDFRVSFFYGRDAEGAYVIMSTVVRFNNAFGRAYFLPVRPVHRRIVPAMLEAWRS